MMRFVLIILFGGASDGGRAIHHIPFQTEALCLEAKAALIAATPQRGLTAFNFAPAFVCVRDRD